MRAETSFAEILSKFNSYLKLLHPAAYQELATILVLSLAVFTAYAV